MTRLCGGIIAAGRGERLRAGAWNGPKPLLPVAGRPLIGHAIDNLMRVGIGRIAIIFNEEGRACADWVRDNVHGAEIDIMVETTASSFESFRRVALQLAGAPAIVTTVDGIMDRSGLSPAVGALESLPPDGLLLGVTDLVDDETPLWITRDPESGRVARVGGPCGTCVAAGVYGLPAAFAPPVRAEFPRLRDYLGAFAESGRPVMSVMLPGVIDIDRRQDAMAAERRLRRVS